MKGLRFGLPAEEEDLFEKLEKEKIISKGFRNILVHRYAEVDDELVFENLGNANDFKEFRKEIVSFLRKH